MKSLASLLLAVAAASACTSHAPETALADTGLRQALLGAWCNSNDGGLSCWAYDEFREDGSFEACGTAEGDALAFRGAGAYSVHGQRMCYVVTQATPNFWLPPGGRYCTDILAVGSRSHRYRDIDTGQAFELYRVPAARKSCPPTP